jgi:3D (Asp-Asp-Asp) domain-containing protein
MDDRMRIAAPWLGLLVASVAGCGPGEIGPFVAEIDVDIDGPTALDAARAADAAGTQADAAAAPDAPPGGPGPLLGTFELTYYYVAAASDYTDTGDETTLYQPTCVALATVPTRFADDVVIEGTGELVDGRVFNYAGTCPCDFSPCFEFEDDAHPWGSGANGRPLVPFRSIAVDRDVLTIGARYYVLELDGVLMPGAPPLGGFIHDGCVSADDTGGHILGMHIDFFSALRADYLALDGELQLNDVTLYQGDDRCP